MGNVMVKRFYVIGFMLSLCGFYAIVPEITNYPWIWQKCFPGTTKFQ